MNIFFTSDKYFFFKLSLLLVCLSGIWQEASAQGYLRFKENKGQWNEEVLYRAELPNGHIYLRQGGITYSFMNPDDMDRLRESFHGGAQNIGKGDGTDSGYYDVGPRHHGPSASNHQPKATFPKPGFSYEDPLILHGHAYQVNFKGANKNANIITDHQAATRYNYLIGDDSSKWGHNVSAFGGITYEKLYPNIDMHIYSNQDGLKYDMIVYPGGVVDDIQFQYKGADKIYIDDDQLYIKTSVGTSIEVAPYAYQIIDGVKKEIKCKYNLKGNIMSFKVGRGYNPDYTLRIDPNFIFASFSGSTTDNWGYTATYDAAGNFYMGGIVFGFGYPTTTGAFQTEFAGGGNTYGEGGFDISISKLSANGRNLIYATYLGGSGDEQPHSLIVNKKNQLIIAGRTNSGDFPGKKVGGRGSWDITLTALSQDGSTMVGGIVIGGSGQDGVNIADKYTTVGGRFTYSLRRFYGDDARSEVNVDKNGNVVLVGSTQSSNFPKTTGSFQSGFKGSNGPNINQDAVVIKATPDLSNILWASYLGGNEDDAAYVLDFADNGNIYIAGGTKSNDFPGTKNGLQKSYKGGVDGFIAEITPNGKNLVRATYLGTGQADQIYGIQTDKEGDVYVGGTTEGDWNQLFPGKVTHLEGVKYGKQFFCKLNPQLSNLIYTATFGSTDSRASSLPNISPTAFLVDRCENVYMSGWGGQINLQNASEYPTQGTDHMPLVDSKNFTNGRRDGRDFYFLVMKKNAQNILYADTYGQYGGFTDHVDGGTSRFDPNGVIYQAICANCGGRTFFPTGPAGVYSRENGSLRPGPNGTARCNVVGFKIAFNLDGTRGGIETQNRRSNYCEGSSFTFVDTVEGRIADEWRWTVFKADSTTVFHDEDTTNERKYKYTFDTTGTFVVRLIKYNSKQCIETDTSYKRVKIGSNPVKLRAEVAKQPPCGEYKYRFVNLSSSPELNPIPDSLFIWNFGDGTGNKIQENDTIIHYFPGEGTYKVRLTLKDTANFCNTPRTKTFLLNVSNQLKAKIQAPEMFCDPGKHPLRNASLGGTNYVWKVSNPDGSDTSILKPNPRPLRYNFPSEGKYVIKLIAKDTICEMEDIAVDTVVIYPKPEASFEIPYDQDSLYVNKIIKFKNTSKSNFADVDDSLSHMWYFGDGVISYKKNPKHLYSETGTYTISLVVTNAAGCSDTTTKTIKEDIIPRLDMPTAFTPGSGDINGYAAPRAYGVKKIDFSIYNRWGQLVFHTTDPDVTYLYEKGWDGTFNGEPQEMDAYAYVIKAVFYNGEQTVKKGSITLVR